MTWELMNLKSLIDEQSVTIRELRQEKQSLAKRICELQSDLSRVKGQIEKMKCCHSCLSHKLNNLKNCQTCDDNYSKWELAE